MKKILIALVVITLLFTGKTQAQEKIIMTVGPARQETHLDPGEQDQSEVRFYNSAAYPVNGLLSVVDFTVSGDEGAPVLLDDAPSNNRYSGTKWLHIPYNQITIAAHNKVIVPVTIKVPTDARPGGRYVAIYFQPGGGRPITSGSGVASRLASLFYIRVNGNITENAIITRFTSPNNFSEYGPITVNAEILNRGDYHITPKGVIAMINAFGNLVDQVSLGEKNIFPDRSRVYANQAGHKWLFGRYKLALSASYGTQGKVLLATTYVWVIPWRAIAIVILVLLLIYILIKKVLGNSNMKLNHLESELKAEKAEIEKLRKLLRSKKD